MLEWDPSTHCSWDHEVRGPKVDKGRVRARQIKRSSSRLDGAVTWNSKNGRDLEESRVNATAQYRMLNAPVLTKDNRLYRQSQELGPSRASRQIVPVEVKKDTATGRRLAP